MGGGERQPELRCARPEVDRLLVVGNGLGGPGHAHVGLAPHLIEIGIVGFFRDQPVDRGQRLGEVGLAQIGHGAGIKRRLAGVGFRIAGQRILHRKHIAGQLGLHHLEGVQAFR